MRQSIKNLIILILLGLTLAPAKAVIQGGVDYQTPIDYTKLNQSDLEARADFYYNTAIKSKKASEDMTSALVLYTILTKKDPGNTMYAVRLGKLYDILGKDRLAKGGYYQALGVNHKHPEPYYYLGEFYYDREQYRKALKYYKRAYDAGYSTHYYTLYRMGDLYQKFGDTQNALKYLQSASNIEANSEILEKIHQIENADNLNKEYYKK